MKGFTPDATNVNCSASCHTSDPLVFIAWLPLS